MITTSIPVYARNSHFLTFYQWRANLYVLDMAFLMDSSVQDLANKESTTQPSCAYTLQHEINLKVKHFVESVEKSRWLQLSPLGRCTCENLKR